MDPLQLTPFKLERYFAEYEFTAPYILSASDCESLRLDEALSLADAESQALWQNLNLGYTDSAGHPALRSEIAGLYESIHPDEALVLAPEEGIFIALQTLLQSGDEAVVVSPAYQSLHSLVEAIGCKAVPWIFHPSERGWTLALDELESNLSRNTRLIVINFPHNPTGGMLSVSELDRILEIARRRGLYIFSDEMYRLLEWEPNRRLPAVCDLYERGISLSGMSKSFGMPGLRIGWLATHDPELMKHWTTFKDYTTICSSAPSEILALIGLRKKQAILERNLAIIQANLDHATAFFGRHPELFHWRQPQAGSIAFAEWIGPGQVEVFCQKMLEQAGVLIVPGTLFDVPGNFFRLGLGRRDFPEALQRVESTLSGYSMV